MRYSDINTTKKISKIGLGTWQFGSREWGYGEGYAGSEAKAIVRRALELGVTLFDTAEIYGFGRSERILGEALGDDLGSIFLATKILPVMPIAPVVEQRGVASASRIGARKLDLYQVHQPNPAVRDGTIMRGMRALQRTGLVDEVGVSNYSLKRWIAAQEALGSRVLTNQVRYSLADRRPERDLVPYAQAHGRVIIAYSPLFLPENLERAAGLISALRQVAEAHSATPSQVALAWLIRNPVVVVIPGASTVAQLESNVAAADIDLTDGEYAPLADESSRFTPITGPAALPRIIGQRLARR